MLNTRKIERKHKKRFHFKLFFMFVGFEVIFTGLTAPFMTYYGPFENVKSNLVGAAMHTLKHQWIATAFLSEKAINRILKEQAVPCISQDNTISDANVNVEKKDDTGIEMFDVKSSNYKGHMIIINDPTRLRVGYSAKLGTEGELTSEIAKRNNAVAAVNGGAFVDKEWTGTGANPAGIIMSKGEVIYNDVTNKNSKMSVVAFTKSGKLLVGNYSFNKMKELGVTDAVSFEPALIVNGKKVFTKGNDGNGVAPRTAIGQRKDGAIILLVVDGRRLTMPGASLTEVQDILYKYGAINASNLDGGSSSTMYYNDEVINNPSDSVGERTIPSIIYVESR